VWITMLSEQAYWSKERKGKKKKKNAFNRTAGSCSRHQKSVPGEAEGANGRPSRFVIMPDLAGKTTV